MVIIIVFIRVIYEKYSSLK